MNNSLYDDLIKGITKKLKSMPEFDTDIALYFLYHIPKLGSDTYLLSSHPDWSDFEKSFSHRELEEKSTTNHLEILTDDEVNKIANYALTICDVQNLLDEIINTKYFQENKTKNEILKTLIGLFNTFNYDEIEKLRKKRKDKLFQKIIKILLFSIPQFPVDPKYAVTATNENLKFKYIDSIEKRNKYELLYKDFKSGDLGLSERIFLLITFIEGYLWSINDNEELGSFYVGNLYEIIMNGISASHNQLYTRYSFYLTPFDLYIYGDIKPSANEGKLHKKIADVFREQFDSIILFVKSFVAKLNIDSVRSWYELSNPVSPDSIAHGIMNICLPKKIGCYEMHWENNMQKLLPISASFELDEQKEVLERLENLWGCYKETEPFVNIIDFPKEEKDLLSNKNQLLIKTENAFNQTKYIAIEFCETSFSFKNILPQIKTYKYTFKAFLEKLELIHQTASLNLNDKRWYKKAYCSLYERVDEIRQEKQYKKNCNDYRVWEADELDVFFSSQTNESVVVYDFGAFNGRLAKKILHRGKDKIKRIYAIDQNQEYITKLRHNLSLPEKQSDDDLVQTYCCDFRNIHLFSENNREKADLICFANTVFGYFEDSENIAVLKTAYNLLKPGGIIWIDQFNPNNPPLHCNYSKVEDSELGHIPVFEFEIKNGNEIRNTYKLIKTSNIKKPDGNDDYGLYYGNYMYFQISCSDEKLIKCDTYNIKLYTESWFKEIYPQTTFEVKDKMTTVLYKIVKTPSKEDIIEKSKELRDEIRRTYPHSNSVIHPDLDKISAASDLLKYKEIYDKLCGLLEKYTYANKSDKSKLIQIVADYEKFEL